MDNRDQLIVAQVSYKAAIDAGLREADDIHVFAQDIYDGIMQLAGHKTVIRAVAPTAREAVTDAFPGAVEEYGDDELAAPSDEPPYQPDTRDAQEKRANRAWALATLKADLANKTFFKAWYDNRESSAGTNRPALKHKSTTLGLWADDIAGLNIPVSKFAK